MSNKRLNLMILIGMIFTTSPLVASAQEKPSGSQSSNTKAGNEERKDDKAKAASKADSGKKPNPALPATKDTAAADTPGKKTSGAQPKQTRERKQNNKRFVDRNGDGIHDGMEHRFRRKRGEARSGKDTDSRGRHVRQQLRKGADSSPNKGSRGVE